MFSVCVYKWGLPKPVMVRKLRNQDYGVFTGIDRVPRADYTKKSFPETAGTNMEAFKSNTLSSCPTEEMQFGYFCKII